MYTDTLDASNAVIDWYLSKPTIVDNDKVKIVGSKTYHSIFRKADGYFVRWGESQQDDPQWCPHGPELLDIEISTGACKGKCAFCYKSNGQPRTTTKHMTLYTFKQILDKMKVEARLAPLLPSSPYVINQIAFGITDIQSNPDFFAIMQETKNRGIIPNFTTHGLDTTPTIAKRCAELCGGIAVSLNWPKSYDAVKMFVDAGVSQVNIHYMFAHQTVKQAKKIIDDLAGNNSRLAGVKALVLLRYKPKGMGQAYYTQPTLEDFRSVIEYANSKNVSMGFDSCSAHAYLQCIASSPDYEKLAQYVEPCESTLFSAYINVDGDFFACSFCENQAPNWETGISVLHCDNFLQIWNSARVNTWRKTLLAMDRKCPEY